MMRKYGLDEGQLYVEQSTLLEPNNFIPSWEAGDEEKKEVSLALKKLRKKYDDIHMMTKNKDEDLQLIQVSIFEAYIFFRNNLKTFQHTMLLKKGPS
jgi:hypothetical protein